MEFSHPHSSPEPRLHIHENVVFPPANTRPEANQDLEQYFEILKIGRGRRPTYAAAVDAFEAFGHDPHPNTLAGLLRVIGIDTNHTYYGAFTEKRARQAHHDTVKERRRMFHWLGGFGPSFVLVEAETPRPQQQTLKAAMALLCALMPAFACRASDGNDPVGELRRELIQATLSLPFVTAGTEPLTLDMLLEASTRMDFDHFAVVDPLYRPASPSVTIEWTQPANVDAGLGFADSLHGCGSLVGHGPMRSATLRIGEELYFALGPSPRSKYYMQRLLPTGSRQTWKIFGERIRAADEIELGLQPWSIERLRIAPRAKHAHIRVSHANVMAHGLSLFCNPKEAHNPAPSAWSKFYQAWSSILPEPDGEVQ
jgi:hypothetical protein